MAVHLNRRLDNLYAKSIAAQDTPTPLQAQRELNRLLGLYSLKDSPAEKLPTTSRTRLEGSY